MFHEKAIDSRLKACLLRKSQLFLIDSAYWAHAHKANLFREGTKA